MKHRNPRHDAVPPKIGFGRRALFQRRHAHAPPHDEAEVKRLRAALGARGLELAAVQQRIREMERAHDERNAEAEALRRIGEAMGSLFDLEEMLRAVAGVAVQVTSTDSSQVYLLNDTRDSLVLRAVDQGSDQSLVGKLRLKLGEGLAGWVAEHKEAAGVSHDVYHDSRFKFVPELHEERYESMLSVPLTYRGEVIGVINVRTVKPHEYTQTQVRLLQSIAAQVSGAVESSRQYRKLERRASQLSTLSEVSKTLTSDLYLEEILQLIVAATAETLSFRTCTLMLLDEDKQELIVKASQGKKGDEKRPTLKMGQSVAGRALAEGRTITVYDLTTAEFATSAERARRDGLSSLVSVPLLVKNKKIGVINCYTERPHHFTDEELSLLMALGNHAAIAIEHAKLMVKSAIIQEMHHRVKNNLQQVASLLRLQLHYAGERSVEQVLTESLNRILAIASVHELLSREDLDIISVKKIAESILQATAQSVIAPDKHIAMSIEGPDILLPSSQATSVALVLNELVQNAVEHGFGNGYDEGRLAVTLAEAPREVRLLVTNDGAPLSDGFDPRRTESLGLQIVSSLVAGDLQGKFTLTREGAQTVAAIVFAK